MDLPVKRGCDPNDLSTSGGRRSNGQSIVELTLIVPLVLAPMLFAEQIWNILNRRTHVVNDREVMHEPAVLIGLITVMVWFVSDKIIL